MKRFVIILVSCFAVSAQSAIVMKNTTKYTGTRTDSCEQEIVIDEGIFRSDSRCKSGMDFASIYNAKKKMMTFVDHSKKTFFETTEKEMKAAATQMGKSMKDMDDMQKKLREEMKSLTDEQRKKMEKFMPPAGGSKKDFKVVSAKEGSIKLVGKYSCQPFSRTMNGTKLTETCIADWKQAGISFNKYKSTSESMKKYWEDWQKSMPAGTVREDLNSTQLSNGFIVQETGFQDNKAVRETTIQDISEKSTAKGFDSPPSNYKKIENPIMKAKPGK